MQVIFDKPPNFAAIVAVFPGAASPGVSFCFGNTIFSPGGKYPLPHILAHEEVHSSRQLAKGVEEWWTDYLASAEFRLTEEIPAHRAEYERATEGYSRNQRRMALRIVASKLSAKLYGNLVTTHEAKRLICAQDANL